MCINSFLKVSNLVKLTLLTILCINTFVLCIFWVSSVEKVAVHLQKEKTKKTYNWCAIFFNGEIKCLPMGPDQLCRGAKYCLASSMQETFVKAGTINKATLPLNS